MPDGWAEPPTVCHRQRRGIAPGRPCAIRDNAKPTLDKLAELIRLQKPGSVAIEGHTDSQGDDAYNQKLSETRAESVHAYLAGAGRAISRCLVPGGRRHAQPSRSGRKGNRQRHPAIYAEGRVDDIA